MFKFKVFPKTFASFREGAGALYCDGGWTSSSGSRLLCLHILPQSCTTSTSASIGFGGWGTGGHSQDRQQLKNNQPRPLHPTIYSSPVDFTVFSAKVFPTDTPEAQSLTSFSFLLKCHLLRKAFPNHSVHPVAFLGFVFPCGTSRGLTYCVLIHVLVYCYLPTRTCAGSRHSVCLLYSLPCSQWL